MSFRKYAGRAAGATLGFIAGNIPGAVAGYEFMKRTEKTSPETQMSKKQKVGFNSKGRMVHIASPPKTPTKRKKDYAKRKAKAYKKAVKKHTKLQRSLLKGSATTYSAGKFSKPTRSGNKTWYTKYAKRGYYMVDERYGTVTDPDCAWLYHSNYQPEKIAYTIAGALLRSLFKICKVPVGNEHVEIPLTYLDNSGNHRIVYTKIDPISKVQSNSIYDIPNNANFLTILLGHNGTGGMISHLRDFMWNATTTEPYSLGLYANSPDENNHRLVGIIFLENHHVNLTMSSQIIVQNRTKGAESGSNDHVTDRVDNQPVKGMLYEFKNPDPRLRQSQLLGTGITDVRELYSNQGYINAVASWGGGLSEFIGKIYHEPPEPKIWKNIAKTSKVSLEPGYMKKITIYSTLQNRLITLLKKLRMNARGPEVPPTAPSRYHMVMSGKSQILCLEEYLRTPSTNHIILTFEQELKFGAYSFSKKQSNIFRAENMSQNTAIEQIVPT